MENSLTIASFYLVPIVVILFFYGLARIQLYWQILIAIVLGVLFGCFMYPAISSVSWIGDLFIRLLNMLVVPLIFCLLVSALANVESEKSVERLGLKVVIYYVTTTLLAIATGLFLVCYFRPGLGVDISGSVQLPENLVGQQREPFGIMLLNMVPKNVFAAMVSGNMLQTVFFALFVGFFLLHMKGGSGRTLRDFFNSGSELMMNMTVFVIKLAPIGVFAMIAFRIAEFEGSPERLASVTQSVGKFFLVVAGGLAFHMLVIMSVILLIFRVNPLWHLKNMLVPLATAFSTATTNATIPLSLAALKEKEGVSSRVANFSIPLGATINMNGTALYECVVVLFIAQAYGLDLSTRQIAVVTITALLTAIGTPGIPMASLVMITVILNAVGLPVEGIGLVLVTDRLLDMCRTTVNVYGDTCCAVCIAKSEGETLTR